MTILKLNESGVSVPDLCREHGMSTAMFYKWRANFGGMDAYHDTYTSPEPINEFMRDMNVKASNPIFRELLSPSGSEPHDVREMATFFADMQRQERRKGGPVSRRSAYTHKLIRYQRNAIARLSRDVRQG